MGQIIIKDQQTGKSQSFSDSKAGFAAAQQAINAINSKGHTASGDANRVTRFTGGK
ncbi:hypothetical protein IKG16_00825 [Candidatus Saccharibacteria bacterium]|nr:hypothetical protein [Candidatus Saccharibacteria bacterium]